MKTFKHIDAASLEEARSLLGKNESARVIAGGTDLLGVLKGNVHPTYPEMLIN